MERSCALVVIGNEILSGKVQDSNAWFAARALREAGVALKRIAVVPDELDAFAGEWKQWLARATPTVIARPLPFLPGSLYSVTPERARLDIVVESTGVLGSTPFRHRFVVFDRDGLDALVPAAEPGTGPSAARVAQLIEEFFRDYGMFPVVTARDDWLLGIEAIHFLRGLLYQLFIEENAPLPPSGVKQWSSKLTERQRSVLQALPTGGPDAASIVEAHEQVALTFVTEARRVASDLEVAWPEELDACTRRYLQTWGLPALD